MACSWPDSSLNAAVLRSLITHESRQRGIGSETRPQAHDEREPLVAACARELDTAKPGWELDTVAASGQLPEVQKLSLTGLTALRLTSKMRNNEKCAFFVRGPTPRSARVL